MLSKYTNEVILTYDGDEAGQNATRRAVPMLEETGLQVRVLRMQGAKDPDEFLKKYGADRFKLLLEQSTNHIEYALASLQAKYHLEVDDERVAFLQAAAALISGLHSAVEREVYGARAAEAAGISTQAMQLEVKKAFQKRVAKERAKQKQRDLAPAKAQQPVERALHYENMRSAMAEEGLIRMLLREPDLLGEIGSLTPQMFSVPLLGRVLETMLDRSAHGLQLSLASLPESFSPQEIAHLTRIAQKQDAPLTEAALRDYCTIIQEEYEKANLHTPEALLALRDRLQNKKRYGG